MRIYLTGFMGSGKTTVGRILAQQIGCEFIDLDQEIERLTGKTIPEIFETSGEEQFRKWETECLQAIRQDTAVVATGGGCFSHNQEWMLQHGKVIYLQVQFETLTQRIGADASRPLWRNAEILFRERQEHYLMAHWTLDADKPPEEVVSEIIALLKP